MNKKIIFFFSYFVLLFVSCKEKEIVKSVGLIDVKKEISLKLQSNISPTSTTIRLFEDNNREIIAYMSIVGNEICFFDINTSQLIKSVLFQSHGPNGIGTINGFDIVNFDTIFINSSQYEKTLFLSDTSGLIKLKIDFGAVVEDIPYSGIAMLRSQFNTNIKYDGTSVYIGNCAGASDENRSKIMDWRIGYKYNFKNNEASLLPIKFPLIDYSKSEMPCLRYNCIFVEDNIIFSFFRAHDFYISKNTKPFSSKSGKSRLVNKKFRSNLVPDLMGSIKIAVETPVYMSFIYDKYRKVYYRIVYPGIDVKKNDNLLELNEFKRSFSVIIFNEEFNIVGETKMPDDRYNPEMYFINKEGLWLSKNHIKNPEFDPDFLKFQLFKLEQNK